ncbi:hypothetical protein [Streptomyces sp. NPDC058954]
MSHHFGAAHLEVLGAEARLGLTATVLPDILHHDRGRPAVHPNGGSRS